MDSFSATMMGIANHNRPIKKVFDWDKAARLIKQHQPRFASAGLSEDWSCTGGTIYADGRVIGIDEKDNDDFATYTYLSSTWATPTLRMDGVEYQCYVMENNTEWEYDTKWPQSALDILGV